MDKQCFRQICSLLLMIVYGVGVAMAAGSGGVSGVVVDESKEPVGYATVALKGTAYGLSSDEDGRFSINAPSGHYTLVVSMLGYATQEHPVTIKHGRTTTIDVTMAVAATQLEEVEVISGGVSRVKRSAFNTVAVDAKELSNTTKSLSDALSKAPGVKLRESGGVGSDMQLMLDGFTGKHVKIFIDGVPQEGVGNSFGLNNIPVNFADRIEVYKGVVPVGFGADALGGVVNIVTAKRRNKWNLDASYSFGSFNTHKSYVNFSQTLKSGFTYEINAFQNYSDNNYSVYAPIEDFETGRIDKNKLEKVERFHDTYHNEAVVAKVGVVSRPWADRLLVGITYSQMYKDIQIGVRQEIVYGEKHRKGHTLMPSLEYAKRDLLLKGLDAAMTLNYNRNMTENVDTASYKYNWLAETKLLNSPGEQSYQHSRSYNDNWSATATLNYRLGEFHHFTFNHVFNAFSRSNESLLTKEVMKYAFDKTTHKNISGLSYRLMMSERWNLSVFGKYYDLYVRGPIATDANMTQYVETTRSIGSFGYGAAGTFFILPELQAKLSYEKAYRLPTIDEMFGDEDLEMGDIGIRPENSDNFNLNLSYDAHFGSHSIYAEGGLIYRDTKDFIQRNITDLSGGKFAASYVNYGKVQTMGFNLSVRYGYSDWLSIGGNLTRMDVRDNMKTALGSSAPNIAYKQRMPNLPYLYADADLTLTWRNLGRKGNHLGFTYDNHYMHSFSYYSSSIGANKNDYVVPTQFSHNVALSYSICNGRYNVALECKNLTNARLYDNFSLQKAGRAFYAKFRIHFGN
ncbi:MAG: TonB-dependent receptor [Muribaculaceae bacterium]|nr:TonB-dependent receptor [Muribaculaceae bacterium]